MSGGCHKACESWRSESFIYSWVTSDNGIGGLNSAGENNIMMWAALQHNANSMYEQMLED
jgi:hypothetical protein